MMKSFKADRRIAKMGQKGLLRVEAEKLFELARSAGSEKGDVEKVILSRCQSFDTPKLMSAIESTSDKVQETLVNVILKNDGQHLSADDFEKLISFTTPRTESRKKIVASFSRNYGQNKIFVQVMTSLAIEAPALRLETAAA